jgi:hypothetical protein
MWREILLCFYGDFCMNLYFVDSDEAMKRGDEALNASSLKFLRSVKRFIALSLQIFTQRETLHRRCFLWKIVI